MRREQVLKIFQKERLLLDKKEQFVSNLKEKVLYLFKIRSQYRRDEKTEIIGYIKRFNKESFNITALAVKDFNGSILSSYREEQKNKYKELYSKPIVSTQIIQTVYKHPIDTFQHKIGYRCLEDYKIFESDKVPFTVGFEYLSPKFKKEYFNA